MIIKGKIKIDKKTKRLVQRIRAHDIAVIKHKDLDEVAALALLKIKPKLVINVEESISGKYPNLGPLHLVNGGVPILEIKDPNFFDLLREGDDIFVRNQQVSYKEYVFRGNFLCKNEILERIQIGQKNYENEFKKFVLNTLEYASKEIDLITNKLKLPKLKISFINRHLLIVVRGHNYQEDLDMLRSYISEIKPIILGVDGGADALLEAGYRPHIILGDMDSVTDKALQCGAELIVHAYPNGHAPGLDRLQKLNLSAHILSSLGTSEDVAMLLGYEEGADLIVAVGTHSNVIDFLDKGRKGMASTFLVRLKIGAKLVDAKGVSKLYRRSFKIREIIKILFAALIPLVLIIVISPKTYQFVRLIFMRLSLIFTI